MLLHWAILEPAGPSASLAAIRFSSPVRIQSIQIFPSGSRPFSQQLDVVACTEPSAFYLNIYFNAQALSNSEGKHKHKSNNALVPTVLAYPGGQVDFPVDMGVEYATRLMIISGDFNSLSLAVYGEVVPDILTSSHTYQPKTIPQVEPYRLPRTLDPSKSIDPTSLSRALLTLASEAPPLPLIVRLMFCLKPSNEDWDKPGFPYLYADLEEDIEEFDLQKAVKIISRPISDSVNEAAIRNFAARVANCLGPDDDDQAYLLSELLSRAAPQHPMLIRSLLEYLDIVHIFNTPNLNKSTLTRLLDASANPDVARQLNEQHILDSLLVVQDGYGSDNETREIANKLYNRIKGWELLEDALSNTQADFTCAADVVRDVACDENSFGIWLESMITHQDLIDKLADNRLSSHSSPHPLVIWNNEIASSHEDFISFLRAFVGVSTAVSVYAWSDSVPFERCRERTLAVLRLWQGVEGYREILDHLLLLRQMTFRLECMLPLDDDLPSQSGIDAERMLSKLAREPQSMLRPDCAKVVQSLGQTLTYITDKDVTAFRRAADLAEGGLTAAIKIVTAGPVELISSESLFELRVALAIVTKELNESRDGEWHMLQAVWKRGYHSLPTYLGNHFARVSQEIRNIFSLTALALKSQEDTTGFFKASGELLELLIRLVPISPLPGRQLSALTHAIADLFISADSADLIYPQGGSVCATACTARQTCIRAIGSFVKLSRSYGAENSNSVMVLKTLLEHAVYPRDHNAAHHAIQSFRLFDHALPSPATDLQYTPIDLKHWVRQVMPGILAELRSIFRVLEVKNKVHLVQRLVNLDDGVVGVGEWLLLEELSWISTSIMIHDGSHFDSDRQAVEHWRISSSFQVLLCLMQDSPASSSWCMNFVSKVNDAAMLLTQCFNGYLERDMLHATMSDIALCLSPHCAYFIPELRSTLLWTLLRTTHLISISTFALVSSVIEHAPNTIVLPESWLSDVGSAFEAVAEAIRDGQCTSPEIAESLLLFAEWLIDQNSSTEITILPGVKAASLEEIFHWMAETLPHEKTQALNAIKYKLEGSEGHVPVIKFISNVDQVELPLSKWEDIFRPPVPLPSTPTRKPSEQSADMLGLVAVSPPNALLRSPEVKGLTKTYLNNDFRQLRQMATARQNTSRLPSMHVDDFELGPSLAGSPPAHTLPGSFGSLPDTL